MTFKQSHDDRCCYIIRQICHNFDRTSLILFICNLPDICLQDITMYHRYIIPLFQRILKNRDQRVINLNCSNLSGRICQILSHRSDSWSDFQYKIIFCNFRCLNDPVQNTGIDQKILTKPFLEHKSVLLKNFNGIFRVSKIRSGHNFLLLLMLILIFQLKSFSKSTMYPSGLTFFLPISLRSPPLDFAMALSMISLTAPTFIG